MLFHICTLFDISSTVCLYLLFQASPLRVMSEGREFVSYSTVGSETVPKTIFMFYEPENTGSKLGAFFWNDVSASHKRAKTQSNYYHYI